MSKHRLQKLANGTKLVAEVDTPIKGGKTVEAGTVVTIIDTVNPYSGEYFVVDGDDDRFCVHVGDDISPYPFRVYSE